MKLFLLVTIILIAFAGNSLLNRLALASGAIGAEAFTFIRIASAAVVLGLIAAVSGQKINLRHNLLSGAFLFIYAICFSIAYLQIDAALGALILFGVVQITMFGGAVLSGERPSKARWTAMVMGIIGLAILVGPSSAQSNLGASLLMCVSGVSWGLFSLLGKKSSAPIGTMTSSFMVALLPAALFMFPNLESMQHIAISGWVLALTSGIVTSGMGYALWYAVLPKLDASLAAIAQLMVPVIAAFGAVLFLKEQISMRFILASILIVGAIMASILWEKRGSLR